MKSDRVYLVHIQECIAKIEAYTSAGRKVFLGDQMVQDAVLRNFEVIGEAANKVSLDFRQDHSEVDWKRAIALRNVLIHNYMGVDIRRVWRDVTIVIPGMKSEIQKMLISLPTENEE